MDLKYPKLFSLVKVNVHTSNASVADMAGPAVEIGVVEEGRLRLIFPHSRFDGAHHVHVRQAGDFVGVPEHF